MSEHRRRILVGGLLLIGSLIYVAWLILALSIRNRPFPGFFLDPNLVVNDNGDATWPSELQDPPLAHPERVVAINGTPITSKQQLDDLLENATPGEQWQITFDHPNGSSRTLTLPLFTFSSQEFGRYFSLSFLIGAFILLVGFWAFRVHPDAPVAQYFALFAVLAAFGIGGLFDMLTTQFFGRLWVTGVVFVGVANLYTAIEFPHRPSILQNIPVLRWVPIAVTLPLFIWAQIVLYNQNAPWLYVTAWRVAYVVDGVTMILTLILFAYRAFASPVPLARQQGRIITLAAAGSFFPIIIWFLNAGYVHFDPLLLFTPTILYPLGMGYTIIRYRLLNVDVVLRRAITYGFLTISLTAALGLVTAFVSGVLGVSVSGANAALLIALVLLITFLFDPLRKRVQLLVDDVILGRPRYEMLLHTYNQELTSVGELEGGATLVLQYVRRGVPHTDVQLFLPDMEHFVYKPHPTGLNIEVDVEDPFVTLLSRDRGALVLTDERAWPEEWRPHQPFIQKMNAAILVPLISTRQLIGWITLSRKHNTEQFTAEEINYLNLLADQSLLGIDRVRAMHRLENRVAEMNDLSRFSQQLNMTQKLDELLEIIVSSSMHLLHSRNVIFVLREPGTKQMYTAYYVENDRRRRDFEGPDKMIQDPYIQEALTKGQMLQVGNEKEGEWLVAPLNAGTDTIGVLQVRRNPTTRPATDRQRQLFSFYVSNAATALARWQANEQTKERAQQLETLNEVIRTLNSIREPDSLLDLILDKSIELLNAEAGSFLIVDQDTGELEFKLVRGPTGQTLLGTRLPIGTGVAGTVAQTGQPAIVNKAQEDPRWFSGVDSRSRFTTQSILSAPLVHLNEVWGVLQIVNKHNGAPFNEMDLTLINTFAGQAVVAMDNARLLQQTDQALQRRVHELAILQQLGRNLNTTLDLNRVLEMTLDWAMLICEATAGSILLMDDKERVAAFVSENYARDFALPADVKATQLGVAGEVIRAGEARLTRNVKDEPGYIAAAPHTRSQLTLPIGHKQRVIGALVIESNAYDAFDEEDREAAASLVNVAATSIANAQLYEQVNEANRAKSEFVSMVSHELKTPITAIRGYTDLMLAGLTGEVNDKQKSFLETITANIKRMDNLIKDLTDISRIETNQLNVHLEPISFANVVSETMQATRGIHESKNISVNLEMPNDLPPVMGDHSRLVQVLTNLLSNAYKYSPPDTQVMVMVQPGVTASENGNTVSRSMVICSVKDTGYGISPEDQARLFTKFFRSEDSNIRTSPGTGLGLSITKGIIELHRGQIWLDSELGQGTTFHFSIPLA
ncbi:MAG: GAF domain-containing protein [Chloroflexi bacterium]|nr:GAF domain-containing protein [Chloroflexota bacterium]MBP8058900.1 GAF domain-containing protein [Chloroflexota bacterium]